MLLTATDGDLSANGMLPTATTINVSPKQAKVIFEWQKLCAVLAEMETMEEMQAQYKKMKAIQDQIFCFPNKYYYRTTWAPAK